MNKIEEAVNESLHTVGEKLGVRPHYERHPKLFRAGGAIAALGLATGLAFVVSGDINIGGTQFPETAQQRAYDPVAIHRSIEAIQIGEDVLAVDALATGA